MGLPKNIKFESNELKSRRIVYDNERFVNAIKTNFSEAKEKDKYKKIETKMLKELVKDHSLEIEDVVGQLRLTNHSLRKELSQKIEAKQKVMKALIAERELGQLKTNFLSLATHEIRTPLSGILTSASLIEKYSPKLNEDVKRHLDTIKSMVNHLGNILDDFLNLDRIDSGKISYKFCEFEFNNLMERIFIECQPLLKEGQTINYIPCDNCSCVYQDEKIFHVILTNVIFNAIKYSPEGSIIDVSVESKDNLIIKVSDKGIGIPANEQNKIFSKFFRASNAFHVQGTGIGLNIVEANVIGLGGTISFLSEEGKGSTFLIQLPKNIES